jgi:hypothetical protein
MARGVKKNQWTEEEVIKALQKAQGILTATATVLGCTRQTVAAYIARYPAVAEAHKEAKESAIDFVESQLLKNIKKGDTTAAIFFLKTQGRGRGYVERQEISGPNGGPIETKTKHDLSKLNVDELLQLRSMLQKTDATTND